MTSTLRNNLLVHWAIPVELTLSVHACDKICLSVDYSTLPFETHAVLTGIEDDFNRKIRGPGEAKTFFHNLLGTPLFHSKYA